MVDAGFNIEVSLMAALAAHPEISAPAPTETDGLPSVHDALSFPTSSANEFNFEALSAATYTSSLPAFAPAPTSTSHQPTPIPDAKRPLETDGIEEETAKRIKTEEHFDNLELKPEPDLEAQLRDALAAFDPPQSVSTPAPVAAPEHVPEHRSPTTTPRPDRVEDKIMKASSNSRFMIRSMSLPVLGNLAVQILLRLSQQSRIESELLLADTGSEFRSDYDSLIRMFFPARQVFSDSPLFFPDDLDITDSDDRETIRMSNLATIATSIFGANDVSLVDVHKHFFSIFIPEDGGYRQTLTDLLVNLKTQVLVDSLRETEDAGHVISLLDELFPINFEESLKQRSGDVALNSDEEILTNRVRDRRDQLISTVNNTQVKEHLRAQYPSGQFAEDLSNFLRSDLSMVVEYGDKYGVNIPLSQEDVVETKTNGVGEGLGHFDLASLVESAASNLVPTGFREPERETFMADMPGSLDDGLDIGKLLEQSLSNHNVEIAAQTPNHAVNNSLQEENLTKDLASLISESLASTVEKQPNGLPNIATPYHNNAAASNTPHQQYMAQTNQMSSQSYTPYPATQDHNANGNGVTLPPHQTETTAVLYERARQAAVAKSSSTARREGLHSTRRPWSPEEEKALMAGLDMVKGPHWSQILSLFGPQGSISQILKDRTQVQLKDKARNLKLFFLKTNSEMPFYLQSVTGELKTRAPTQAARKEAEEKARQNAEEEQARIQGIMTLGGLHNGHQQSMNGPLAASTPNRASPVTTGASSTGSNLAPAPIPASTGSAPPVAIPALVKPDTPGLSYSQHSRLAQAPANPMTTPAPIAPMTQNTLKPQPPRQPQQVTTHHHQQHTQHTQHAQQSASVASPPQQQQQQYHQQSHMSSGNNQAYLPPMPPNHHSTPDHQDAKLFEVLSAAVAATTNEPAATETSAN